MFTSPKPKPGSAQFFLALAELRSKIYNLFEPEPNQAQILTLSISQASPAQVFVWLKPGWAQAYTGAAAAVATDIVTYRLNWPWGQFSEQRRKEK